MFTHSTTDYDFIIHLNTAVLPRYYQNVAADGEKLSKHGKYSNPMSTELDTVVRPGFDPARSFFFDLQVRFEIALYTDDSIQSSVSTLTVSNSSTTHLAVIASRVYGILH